MISDAQRIKELLEYNPETGIFIWKNSLRPGWNGKVAGSKRVDGYLSIGVGKKDYLAHRLAWIYSYGEWPVNQIDHIDHNRSNNKINNLRDVTHAENNQNQIVAQSTNHSTNTLGVYYEKNREKYQSAIWIDGKKKHLGRFANKDDAYDAYVAAKRIFHSTCVL